MTHLEIRPRALFLCLSISLRSLIRLPLVPRCRWLRARILSGLRLPLLIRLLLLLPPRQLSLLELRALPCPGPRALLLAPSLLAGRPEAWAKALPPILLPSKAHLPILLPSKAHPPILLRSPLLSPLPTRSPEQIRLARSLPPRPLPTPSPLSLSRSPTQRLARARARVQELRHRARREARASSQPSPPQLLLPEPRMRRLPRIPRAPRLPTRSRPRPLPLALTGRREVLQAQTGEVL
mmetsp:Transcript_14608/g.22680  ORF Transcript_14608/g.22680 Transcript_14608/m.22680 type:complete len:238 (+) Transcript_14608:994-1707(+)